MPIAVVTFVFGPLQHFRRWF